MKTYLAVSLLAVAASFAATPACAQQLVPAGSEIAFTSKQMGVPVDGRFRKFDAKVAFDPKKPEAANIAFSVDLASVSLGVAETEAEIAKPDWFDTKKFPQALFQSSGETPSTMAWKDCWLAWLMSFQSSPSRVIRRVWSAMVRAPS